MATASQANALEPSALRNTLDVACAKSSSEALPLEILHNLRYQHNWSNLEILRPLAPTREDVPSLNLCGRSPSHSGSTTTPTLLSGTPPKAIYLHPDYQAHLLLQKTPFENLDQQIEYVFPLTLGQSFTLRLLHSAFDSIPLRESIKGANGFRHQDAKRILLAMRGRQGVGGDGTINYYVVQEGEVKPRQN